MHWFVTQQEGRVFSRQADQKKPLLVVWVYILLSSRHCVALKLPASDETLFTVLSFSSLVSLKVRGMDYLLIQKDATPCPVPEGSVFQLHTHTLCTWFVSAGNCIWCLQAYKRQVMHVKSWRSLMFEIMFLQNSWKVKSENLLILEKQVLIFCLYVLVWLYGVFSRKKVDQEIKKKTCQRPVTSKDHISTQAIYIMTGVQHSVSCILKSYF